MKFPSSVNSRLPQAGLSIFSIMSNLAKEHDALNLSQGFPNFDAAPELISLVNKWMTKGCNQYAPMPGIMELREAIAEKTEECYSAVYNPDTEITVTAGATQAIFTAITATIREDDEVIIFTPAYDCYGPAVELNGGKPVFVKMKFPQFTIDWDSVKKLINHRTRMIILNSPHNPSGATLSAADMKKLENITRNSDIIILSDEVYEHIIFDGKEHQSVARYPKLAERSFIISSFGKTYHTTGWKTGYCLAPENLMAEFRKVHQYLLFSVHTPTQYAFAEYLSKKDAYIGLSEFYQKKRDTFRNAVMGSAFNLMNCDGTYFQLLGYKDISEEKDTEFAKRLTIEHKIASIPVSVFYSTNGDNKVLRFCFAKDDDTLKRAGDILHKIK